MREGAEIESKKFSPLRSRRATEWDEMEAVAEAITTSESFLFPSKFRQNLEAGNVFFFLVFPHFCEFSVAYGG